MRVAGWCSEASVAILVLLATFGSRILTMASGAEAPFLSVRYGGAEAPPFQLALVNCFAILLVLVLAAADREKQVPRCARDDKFFLLSLSALRVSFLNYCGVLAAGAL